MLTMLQHLFDIILPVRSLTGTAGTLFTHDELKRLRQRPVLLWTGELREKGVQSLDRLIAAGTYDDAPVLQTAIRRFKYRRVRSLRTVLGSLMVNASPLLGPVFDAALCPVPLHWTRRFSRGFNQAEDLAHEVSQSLHIPVRLLLRRTVPTGHQAHKSREERKKMNADIFAVTTHDVPPHVILIDDVATTMSTLDACALSLKQVGVERVSGLVLALG